MKATRNSSRGAAHAATTGTGFRDVKSGPPAFRGVGRTGIMELLPVKEAIATRVFDPFQYAVELPHEIVLHPLGGCMRLKTNSRDVIEAAQESWSGFPAIFSGHPIELRVAVSE